MLLGSTSIKVVRKTLVKLTPGHYQNDVITFCLGERD